MAPAVSGARSGKMLAGFSDGRHCIESQQHPSFGNGSISQPVAEQNRTSTEILTVGMRLHRDFVTLLAYKKPTPASDGFDQQLSHDLTKSRNSRGLD